MISRRATVAGLMGSVFCPQMPIAQTSTEQSFSDMLEAALADFASIEAARRFREGLLDAFNNRAIAPRLPPSDQKISDDAVRLIVGFEVTGKARYEGHYKGVIWPKGQSGPTIGIGYDVGYVTTDWLVEDWKGILPASTINSLKLACGVRGAASKQVLPRLKSVQIEWADAMKQFTTTALPRYAAETIGALPNATMLNADCFGALVSL